MAQAPYDGQPEKPCGPTILVTTVTLSLVASGSGVKAATTAPTGARLDSPLGKQQTCSTRVAVTLAPGARSAPGPGSVPGWMQAARSLQVNETKFN